MKGPIRCRVEAKGAPLADVLLKSAPDYLYSSPSGSPGWKVPFDRIQRIDRHQGHVVTKSGQILPLRGIVQYQYEDDELPERIDAYVFTFDSAGEAEAYVRWGDLRVLEFTEERGSADPGVSPRGLL